MTNEEKIKKWLAGELSEAEKKEFESTEEFAEISKLLKAASNFKAPEYDVVGEYKRLSEAIHIKRPVPIIESINQFLKIAAILILTLTIGYLSWLQFRPDTNSSILIVEQEDVYLPDSSFVSLNDASSISYESRKWQEERKVDLSGEAFFRVKKGSQFNVNTEHGKVTVLGTEFTVKDREDFYQVSCYSGTVKVTIQAKSFVLQPNSAFRNLDGKDEIFAISGKTCPDWLKGESSFKSVPLKFVIRELERQYKVSVESGDVDLNQLFTGSFSNENLEVALKAITFPLKLNYEINDNIIVITFEDK